MPCLSWASASFLIFSRIGVSHLFVIPAVIIAGKCLQPQFNCTKIPQMLPTDRPCNTYEKTNPLPHTNQEGNDNLQRKSTQLAWTRVWRRTLSRRVDVSLKLTGHNKRKKLARKNRVRELSITSKRCAGNKQLGPTCSPATASTDGLLTRFK